MKGYRKEDMSLGLEALGVTAGDAIYVSSSLFQLGPPMEGISTKDALCQAVFEAIWDVLGSDGTVVVPTFTPQAGRIGEPFVLEETPAETGMFSEFVRQRPDAVRSLHPINSVASVGRHARDICEDVPANSSAIDSPSYRLYEMDAKAITLGAKRPLGAWAHLLEALYGVPYKYNKLLDIKVYAGGKKVETEFYANVCYLDFDIRYDILGVENTMVEMGAAKFHELGDGRLSCISGHNYFEAGMRILQDNVYAFLQERPKFRHGEVPYDGPTANREGTE